MDENEANKALVRVESLDKKYFAHYWIRPYWKTQYLTKEIKYELVIEPEPSFEGKINIRPNINFFKKLEIITAILI